MKLSKNEINLDAYDKIIDNLIKGANQLMIRFCHVQI